MNHSLKLWLILPASALALAFALAGCAAAGGGTQQGARTHLSPAQCRDLTALRNKEPLTRERNLSQLAALEAAGYNPSWGFDPYYPADLQAAQKRVDQWYAEDCQQVQPN
ncbi:DUF4148 domain-containing protein [Paraburkholderia sp. SARCC-3016]|uniref:DUF4148 domain-containing protein n=1 Tax=Paraburkholderia sp. SARCC-3016 TaxID=3058611 RepID=UPI002806E7A0|nr:DUF4148 domain-containing protein [Paraburkholderia sp. SARCC-3016]MDQ7980902.1 DUF4148 domain-containing protein [Paraburkholderia sp. SARCC-3016]